MHHAFQIFFSAYKSKVSLKPFQRLAGSRGRAPRGVWGNAPTSGGGGLAGYHPAVQLVYFIGVLTGTMCLQHPVILITAFAGGLSAALCAGRRKALRLFLLGIVPSAVFVGLLNPLVNHAGMTILAYWPDGNPLTLESLIYGAVAGTLFAGIWLWCLYLRYTVSTDGILYLFGRVSPKVSLLLSMILRFLPQFAVQLRQVRTAQHGLGRDMNQGNVRQRGRNTLRILSSVIGLSLENAVQTADALKSRGYGVTRRTAFSPYRFERRDGQLLAVIILCCAVIWTAFFMERLDFYYFPVITPLSWEPLDGIIYAACILLYGLPVLLWGKEVCTWRILRSRN